MKQHDVNRRCCCRPVSYGFPYNSALIPPPEALDTSLGSSLRAPPASACTTIRRGHLMAVWAGKPPKKVVQNRPRGQSPVSLSGPLWVY